MVSINLNNRNWKHIIWLPGVCLLLFGVPFLSLKILKIGTDSFYFAFFVAGLAFLWIYRWKTSFKLKPAIYSGWALGIILAVFIGFAILSYTIYIKSNSVHQDLYSTVPVIFWRGIIFGIIGTTLISVFPFVTVWRAFAGTNPGNLRKFGILIIAVIAMSVTSLSYNIGHSGFDSSKLGYNVKMSVLTGIPTLLSGNPFASPVTGAFLYSGESLFSEDEPDTETVIKIAAKKPGGAY